MAVAHGLKRVRRDRAVGEVETALARRADLLQVLPQSLFRIVVVDRLLAFPDDEIGWPPEPGMHNYLGAPLENAVVKLQFFTQVT